MVERDNVFSGKVKQTGIFDFKELYRFTYDWLVDKGYWVVEKEYTEKVNPNGKEVVIIWEAQKKVTDYFRFFLKIEWRILGMKDVEVEQDGVKVGMNKGNPEIKTSAILIKDYESRWAKSSFTSFLRSLYDRYVIRSRIEQMEDKLFSEGDEFLAQAKAFLALEGNRY